MHAPDHGLNALDELGVLLVGNEWPRADGRDNVIVVDGLLLRETEGGWVRARDRRGRKGEVSISWAGAGRETEEQIRKGHPNVRHRPGEKKGQCFFGHEDLTKRGRGRERGRKGWKNPHTRTLRSSSAMFLIWTFFSLRRRRVRWYASSTSFLASSSMACAVFSLYARCSIPKPPSWGTRDRGGRGE